jgi:hypothetical protein
VETNSTTLLGSHSLSTVLLQGLHLCIAELRFHLQVQPLLDILVLEVSDQDG